MKASIRSLMAMHCISDETACLLDRAAKLANLDLDEERHLDVDYISEVGRAITPAFVRALEERRRQRLHELRWTRSRNPEGEVLDFVRQRIEEFWLFRRCMLDAYAVSVGMTPPPLGETSSASVIHFPQKRGDSGD